jgi:hypothetical protein
MKKVNDYQVKKALTSFDLGPMKVLETFPHAFV